MKNLPQNTAALNLTAYRIYKIFQWLRESPQTVGSINNRLALDPLLGKAVSEDSIWLYLNTLRAVGCEISRPTPSNGFQFVLQQHPFGFHLSEADVELLKQVKARIETRFSYKDVLSFNRWLGELLHHTVLPATLNVAKGELKKLLGPRNLDYASYDPVIQQLESAIQYLHLLEIDYASASAPHDQYRAKTLLFIADRVYAQQGVLYVQGVQHGRKNWVTLRLDRVLAVREQEDSAVRDELISRLREQHPVWIRLFGITLDSIEPFGMDESLYAGMTEEGLPCLELRLMNANFFALKQKLLSLGVPFEVKAPLSLRHEFLETLTQMKALYPVEQEGLSA